MNKATAVLATALTFFLSACGLLAEVVPPIDITDTVAPLDGETIVAPFRDANDDTQATLRATSPRASAIVVSEAAQEVPSTDVDDLIEPLDTYGFDIARITIDLGLGDAATLTGPYGSTFPEAFTLSHASLDITASDLDATRTAHLTLDKPLDLRFTRTSSTCQTDCTYHFDGDAANALDIDLNDTEQIMSLLSILEKGPEATPNVMTFDVRLEATSGTSLDDLNGTFTLHTGKAEIHLGG